MLATWDVVMETKRHEREDYLPKTSMNRTKRTQAGIINWPIQDKNNV
jgi:hypothetical protein